MLWSNEPVISFVFRFQDFSLSRHFWLRLTRISCHPFFSKAFSPYLMEIHSAKQENKKLINLRWDRPTVFWELVYCCCYATLCYRLRQCYKYQLTLNPVNFLLIQGTFLAIFTGFHRSIPHFLLGEKIWQQAGCI